MRDVIFFTAPTVPAQALSDPNLDMLWLELIMNIKIINKHLGVYCPKSSAQLDRSQIQTSLTRFQ